MSKYKYQYTEQCNIEDTPFKDFTKIDWMNYYIERYSQIDGEHHKDWVFDQLKRIYHGSDIHVDKRVFINIYNGEEYIEYDVTLGEPTKEYCEFIENEEKSGYFWEKGIAP